MAFPPIHPRVLINIEEESECQDMEKAQRQDPEIRLIMLLVENREENLLGTRYHLVQL